MILSDVSVRRPVFAVMMTTALIVLGAVSYFSLGLDLMPKTDSPVVTVSVSLPGASAEEVETQLTKRIEEAVNTISGIDELNATSSQGSSRVSIAFFLERDIESATQDVRDKVATIVGQFPRDALAPQIQKIDPDSAPVFSFAMFGPRAPKELAQIAEKQIKQGLETLPGVGSVSLSGQRKREIQLLLNPDRLSAYGLTVDQVRAAVQRQNVEVPGGSFVSGPAEVALRTMGRIQNVDDFNRIVLTYKDGAAITFADIGRVQDSVEEVRGATRIGVDGVATPAVLIQVVKQSGSNTVEVVDRIKARLEQIQAALPPDLTIMTGSDQSIYIRKSFEEIRMHLLFGGLLACVVVYLFTRNFRVTVIAGLAVPASLIGTFTVMKAFGFTLNNMTMLALSLATGIVIDDAIVVLENIFRFVEEKGMSPKKAAVEGTKEIGLAVMATTLSLVVIFVPVAFMTGQIGRYFFSFGITSAAAILLSMFVSFTLTPALAAWWLRLDDIVGQSGEGQTGHSTSKSKGFYAWLDRTYGVMLGWAMRHRLAMMVMAAAVTASAVFLYPYVGRELVPDDDQGEFNISVRLPRGTSYPRTEEYIQPIEKELLALPALRRVRVQVNPGSGSFGINMVDLEERTISQQELMVRARTLLRKYQGARISVSGGTDISGASSGGRGGGGGGGNRLQILIQGADVDELQRYTVELMDKLRSVRGVADVDSSYEPTQPELRVTVDRTRAADLGVNIDTLATGLRTLVGGEEVSEFKDGDDQFVVRLRLDESYRSNPAGMGDLLVPTATGRTVRVSDVAMLRNDSGPASIDRYNRQRQISVIANIQGAAFSDVLAAAREKVDDLHLKPGYNALFGGSAKALAEASDNFTLAIILAILFIYMVLASQFNSFVHPLTIMTALPLSLPAGLLSLMAFGMTINVYSAIGLMMLFGIVKKNSILQVDYTNTLREQGLDRHAAIITANHVRLRPILMTTIAIIAGMIPIALGRGAGSGSRASMAVTIIGGQVLCLLLSLLVTPVVYSYFDDLREWSPAAWFGKMAPKKKVEV
ncbi:MAG: efflux RND transporter permease subunit [Acidobacteriaceae bacterium]|jgi:HAE1 family hydrophobic/amphiphilic exporter-1|nr:efflux RND transporter permease subunit [Acidobacteriaceae bacterium]